MPNAPASILVGIVDSDLKLAEAVRLLLRIELDYRFVIGRAPLELLSKNYDRHEEVTLLVGDDAVVRPYETVTEHGAIGWGDKPIDCEVLARNIVGRLSS